jgi:hypothetical protein
MANLLGQNIGTNYKGILNLDSTINTPLDATLRAVTDGEGDASPLQLSTDAVSVGAISGARFAIKGSGTTSGTTSLLVQDSAGTESFKILDNGAAFIRTSLQLSSGVTFITNTNTLTIGTTLGNVTGNVGTLPVYTFSMISDTSTSNTSNYFSINKTISPSAGSANFRNLIVDYTINASGVQTGTATGIFLNATETNLNGMSHNLLDLQVGGVSRLKVTNTEVQIGAIAGARLAVKGSGSTSATTSLLVQNSAGSELFKVTDNGAISSLSTFTTLGGVFAYGAIEGAASGQSGSFSGSVRVGSGGSNNASAILDAVSTTKGFLPPRMTTTQKNAIATPAAGLIVYDTTTNKLACYNGTTWNDLF